MKSMRRRIAIGAASVFALGGSALGIAITTASASTPTTDVSTLGVQDQSGSQVQSGDQTAADTNSATSSEATSEASAPTASETDAPGGHQDPAGNVDNQSTTEQ